MIFSYLNGNILIMEEVLNNDKYILSYLKSNIIWDNSINSRKTASFGVPYNYSNISYDFNEIPSFFDELVNVIKINNNFTPNNCLINFYYDKNSKMGYHSDQIDILYSDTGIAIFSFGAERIMRFKNKSDKNLFFDIKLKNNSYLYMSQKSQIDWLHSILPSKETYNIERFSVTFRKIK
jgi:alkylated DNA repair dioxygenase AlkB